VKKKQTQVDESEEMENFIDVIKRNCKKYPQFKSLLKLIGWAFFFLIIFILFTISKIKSNIQEERNNNETTTTTKVKDEKESYKDVINKLLRDNTKYKYDIELDKKVISISGEINNNVLDGYYETDEGTIHYRVKEEQSYVVKGTKEEIDNNVFNEIETYFIYPIRLVNILTNNLSTKISNDGVNKHEYKDIKIGDKVYQITVYEDSSKINKIEAISGNYSYIITIK
jgi:hypothetical protein